jgi:RND family efflux transporter MFP subunit
MLPSVRIDTVKRADGETISRYAGVIRGGDEIGLSFKVAGTIQRVFYPEGAFVKAGALVAQMDQRDYMVQLSATEAEYNEIKSLAGRVSELYEKGSATKNDYEKAKSGLEQITAKYNHHKHQVADTRLLAPQNGYIIRHLYQAGETVAAGMPVVSFAANNGYSIDIDLSLKDYLRKADFKGFTATCVLNPARPEPVTFPITLKEIASQANANGLYRAVFIVHPVDTIPLAIGMSVEVNIDCNMTDARLFRVPVSAIFDREGKPHVWIYRNENEGIQSRPVEIKELTIAGDAIVSGGVENGEMVVSAGVHSIQEGMKATVAIHH